MLSRSEFPYLQSFVINDAYAVKNLTVPIFEGANFKHLILTGKNGSGKTTVLTEIKKILRHDLFNTESVTDKIATIRSFLQDTSGKYKNKAGALKAELDALNRINITLAKTVNQKQNRLDSLHYSSILSFFEASRKFFVTDVNTVTKDLNFSFQHTEAGTEHSPATLFKQYLVNKKVYQAFKIIDGDKQGADLQESFFVELEKILGDILDIPNIKLEFEQDIFEFYIRLADGRRITFNQLSAGFSAFLSILTDLLLRTDILRKQANDYSYDPCGFVFIDEPETHLHLEMQYQILPWLTRLFPNLQFIVATHSPAVASSIKNATVFDLTTGQSVGDTAAGSSYSELMLTHFGVKDEYSNVADEILASINRIVALPDAQQARRELQALLAEKGRYMSAGLLLEVEAQLMGLQGA